MARRLSARALAVMAWARACRPLLGELLADAQALGADMRADAREVLAEARADIREVIR